MAETVERIKAEKISGDLMLIAVLGAAGILLAGGYALQYGAKTSKSLAVNVSVNGVVVQQYPFSGTVDEVISGVNGGSNHLHIEQGQVWVDEASCPDQICVHMGKINEEGQAIICLPNRIVVEIVSDR